MAKRKVESADVPMEAEQAEAEGVASETPEGVKDVETPTEAEQVDVGEKSEPVTPVADSVRKFSKFQ